MYHCPVKNLTISDELHTALKSHANREGRMLIAEVAIALRNLLGKKFPKRCKEFEFLPEHLR